MSEYKDALWMYCLLAIYSNISEKNPNKVPSFHCLNLKYDTLCAIRQNIKVIFRLFLQILVVFVCVLVDSNEASEETALCWGFFQKCLSILLKDNTSKERLCTLTLTIGLNFIALFL
jgi:hypothetical protein